jgi:signal transduction histidine kinase/ligand-binding sensor domain-containing protein
MLAWVFSLLAWCPPAFALNPSADVSQYAHTAWKVREGFAGYRISAIAQTPDGYLWLGTEGGLLRFDGVRVVPWQPPSGTSLPSPYIRSLLSARDGTIWIGTIAGLASWKGRELTQYPALNGMGVDSLVEDGEGTVWASGPVLPAGRVCAIRAGSVTCRGEVGRWATTVREIGGSIWVAAESGLWRWAPGEPRLYRFKDMIDANLQAIADDGAGAVLVTTVKGLRRFRDGADTAVAFPASHAGKAVLCVFTDRNGGVWVGTRRGIVHIHEGRTDVYARADGLSGDTVGRIFEDREGNVWVATNGGLDRFHDYAAVTITGAQGLPDSSVGAVLGAEDGTVWLSSASRVTRWREGHLARYNGRGHPTSQIGSFYQEPHGRIWASFRDGVGYFDNDQFVTIGGVPGGIVNAIVEDPRGTLWLANWTLGLLRVTPTREVERIPWSTFSREDPASRLAVDAKQGGLWIGFTQGGLAFWADGRVRASYTTTHGLGAGRVGDLSVERDGTVWAATQGGLSLVKDGRIVTMTSRSGLPCDGVDSMLEDSAGSVWLYMTCGIARLSRDDLTRWVAAAVKDPSAQPTIRASVLDGSDGIRSFSSLSTFSPRAARSGDGKLWFAAQDGISVVDPRHLPFNSLLPPVHIEQIIANHIAHDVTSITGDRLDLPPLTGDLQIDYTALSLVAPERVRFRYKLEGWDRDWQEAGTRRQAFYTNLPPRTYRFRVTASNNSGVWNDTGAALDFTIAPAYYQTTWFLALSAALIAAAVWSAHRIRLGIVETHQREITGLNERLMKAQEQERMRIAGELHDGVAQEMLAVTMMLGTAKRRMGEESPAMPTIDKIQHKLLQMGTDIRQISHDLHPPVLQEAGLPEALRSYCAEFSGTSGIPVTCDADEAARDLSRGASLALFRIAQEALGNAAKHASATRIDVRLTRANGDVMLTVSDNGTGFDRHHMGSGGLGLITMRERAGQLNGRFEFESAPGRGTTIRVTIPFR